MVASKRQGTVRLEREIFTHGINEKSSSKLANSPNAFFIFFERAEPEVYWHSSIALAWIREAKKAVYNRVPFSCPEELQFFKSEPSIFKKKILTNNTRKN